MKQIAMDYTILTTLFIILQTVFGKYEQYIGCTVHDVQIRNQDDISFLQALQEELDLDVWRAGMVGGRGASIMVKPEYREEFLTALDNRGMRHSVGQNDVVKAVEEFEKSFAAWKMQRNNEPLYNSYPRYQEIENYLDRLGRDYPTIVTVVTAGQTFDGRNVKYVKISTTNFEDATKPVIMIDAAMHAREWITPPVALYTIHRLVEDLREEDRDLLEKIDWVILPVYNPDGYEFSHTDDRMWRRSRSYNASISTECYGADLNRNFDIFFGQISVSTDPCNNAYPGPYPYSEVETRNVRDIYYRFLDRIQTYFNLHSYGSYVVYGYDNKTLPTNVAQVHHVAAVMGEHIDAKKMADAPYYTVGNSAFVFYGASGTAQDYAQSIGIPFSYTVELPDYGKYQFLVPVEYVPQINVETYAGIAAAARQSYYFYRDRLNQS